MERFQILSKRRTQGEVPGCRAENPSLTQQMLSRRFVENRIKANHLAACREESCCVWDSSSGRTLARVRVHHHHRSGATVKIFPRFPLRSFLRLVRMGGCTGTPPLFESSRYVPLL